MAASDPEPRFRAAERRLRALLLGDGVYRPGIARGEEIRADASRELRLMREAFEELASRNASERVAQVEARVAGLEEELRRLAEAKSRTSATRRWEAS